MIDMRCPICGIDLWYRGERRDFSDLIILHYFCGVCQIDYFWNSKIKAFELGMSSKFTLRKNLSEDISAVATTLYPRSYVAIIEERKVV